MQTVLSGTQVDEPWHIVELPTSAMPAADKEAVLDLASASDVTITTRMPEAGSTVTDHLPFVTVEIPSGTPGLAGKVIVTGSTIVKQVKPNAVTPAGTFYGVAYDLKLKGEVLVDGKPMEKSITGSVGAFAAQLPQHRLCVALLPNRANGIWDYSYHCYNIYWYNSSSIC